jgi:hypothetical protein
MLNNSMTSQSYPTRRLWQQPENIPSNEYSAQKNISPFEIGSPLKEELR